MDCDVIVVGGRCAGAPLAMLLARRGHRVTLVERKRFPSDTVSTLAIHRPGVALLRDWGLLDRVVATGCPSIARMTWQLQDISLAGDLPRHRGGNTMYAPRRDLLDRILLEAAAAAGARIEQASVTDVLWDEGRVVGVRAGAPGGRERRLRSRVVVGADGIRSTVARRVRAEIEREAPRTTSNYYAIYDLDGPRDTVSLFADDGVGALRLPTNDGLTLVAVTWRDDPVTGVRGDLATGFRQALRRFPGLAGQVEDGAQVERLVGLRAFPNRFRRSYGPGWALAGDAGYVKDSVTAQGITDAFISAHGLADAVDAGLRGGRDAATALADYQRRRDSEAMPYFEWTLRMARLRPPRRSRPLLQAIAADDRATTEFFGLNAKITDPRRFFDPGNTARLLADA